jgi:hypothetical protein
MGRAGPEHTALALSKTPISQEQGAQNGTPRASDPDLDELIRRWPGLPEAARRQIMDLAREEADR